MSLCCLVLLSPLSHSQGGIHAVVTGTKRMHELEAMAVSDLSCYRLLSPALVSCWPWEHHIHGWHYCFKKEVCFHIKFWDLSGPSSQKLSCFGLALKYIFVNGKKPLESASEKINSWRFAIAWGIQVTLPFWMQTFEEIINQIWSLTNC